MNKGNSAKVTLLAVAYAASSRRDGTAQGSWQRTGMPKGSWQRTGMPRQPLRATFALLGGSKSGGT